MASDVIGFPHNAAAATLYAIIRNDDGQIWETVGPSFEAYSTANIANYDTALTEQGTASQFYTFTFPSGISAGVYSVAVYIQAGGSPAEGDIAVAEGEVKWDGSAVEADIIAALEDAGLILGTTTIATLANQSQFTLTAGPPDDNVLEAGAMLVIEQAAAPLQKSVVLVLTYTGATKTVNLANNADFTIAVGDKIRMIPVSPALVNEIYFGTNGIGTKLNATKTITDLIFTDTTAIKTDTNELQTDDVPSLIATAQTDLDTITGSDGVTLATAQGNYAPSTATALASLVTTVGVAGAGLTAIFTTALTESYRSTASTGTAAQLLYEILGGILDHDTSGLTKTINKIDGTAAKTYTLDDASNPTSITEAT